MREHNYISSTRMTYLRTYYAALNKCFRVTPSLILAFQCCMLFSKRAWETKLCTWCLSQTDQRQILIACLYTYTAMETRQSVSSTEGFQMTTTVTRHSWSHTNEGTPFVKSIKIKWCKYVHYNYFTCFVCFTSQACVTLNSPMPSTLRYMNEQAVAGVLKSYWFSSSCLWLWGSAWHDQVQPVSQGWDDHQGRVTQVT